MNEAGSEKMSTLSSYDARKIEGFVDTLTFDKLLKTVEQICLGKHLDHPPHELPPTSDATIVAQLGVFGLRTAFEQKDQQWDYSYTHDVEHVSEYDRPIIPDTMLRLPHEFNDETNPEVAHKAEQFGAALLDEAFSCLGNDAYEKARQMKNATSDAEQIEIIYWLDKRLQDISDAKHGIEADTNELDLNDGLYHPVRLSPLAIGRYPNISVAPTCLGVSVLAASFFEKSAINHLHGGVMQAALEGEDISISNYLQLQLEKKFVPEHMEDYVYNVAEQLEARSTQDRGFHAANLLQLQSGAWIQFDSNFGAIGYVENDEDVTETHKTLQDLKNIAPGLELTLVNNANLSNYIINKIEKISDITYDRNELHRALLDSDEAIEEAIRSCLLPPILDAIYHDIENEDIKDFLNAPLDLAFHKCLERLVLWNEPIDTVQQRARTDPSYRDRTIDDMQNLWRPLLLMAPVIVRDLDADVMMSFAHSKLELGLPTQRIGFAVLNDFATYLEADLSPSFWINNWPSHVPRVEAIARHNETAPENHRIIIENNAKWLYASLLQYSKSHDIINSFLKVKGQNNAQSEPQEAR